MRSSGDRVSSSCMRIFDGYFSVICVALLAAHDVYKVPGWFYYRGKINIDIRFECQLE